MRLVRGDVDAKAAAQLRPCRTQASAAAADLTARARQSAAAAIPGVGPRVHARACAQGQPVRTDGRAGAHRADLLSAADTAASATIPGIALLIDTSRSASRAGRADALSVGADQIGAAGDKAGSAIVGADAERDARVAAGGEPGVAAGGANPLVADLHGLAGIPAGATVGGIIGEHHASAPAGVLTVGAVTSPSQAHRAAGAFHAASAAVDHVGMQVDATALAGREPRAARQGARAAGA